MSPACWSSSRRSPQPSATSCRRPRPRRPHHHPSTRSRPRTLSAVGARRGEADSAVPDGTTVFDDEIPGVANLDSDLLGALRQAATDAADDGVEFVVDSGWRSPEYQEQLLRRGGRRSTAQKRKPPAGWPPPTRLRTCRGTRSTSGPPMPRRGCPQHGAEYGLCQIYGNEPWHYELRPEAGDHGCPPMYADPTHDPRMQQ